MKRVDENHPESTENFTWIAFFSWLQHITTWSVRCFPYENLCSFSVEDKETKSQHKSKHDDRLIVWNSMCSICRSSCFQNYFQYFLIWIMVVSPEKNIHLFWDFASALGRLMFTWRSCLHDPIVTRKGNIWKNGKNNIQYSFWGSHKLLGIVQMSHMNYVVSTSTASFCIG